LVGWLVGVGYCRNKRLGEGNKEEKRDKNDVIAKQRKVWGNINVKYKTKGKDYDWGRYCSLFFVKQVFFFEKSKKQVKKERAKKKKRFKQNLLYGVFTRCNKQIVI